MAPAGNPRAQSLRSVRAPAGVGAEPQNCSYRSIRLFPGVKRALQVATQGKPSKHPDCGSKRHRHQESDKAEEIAKGEQREDHPYRMQTDAFTYELWRKHIAFHKLTDEEDSEHEKDRAIGWPELRHRDAQRKYETRHRSDVWNERNQPRDETDQETEIKAAESESYRVERPENETYRRLSAHKPGNCGVYFPRKLTHGFPVLKRDPAVDIADHPVPVVDEVEGDDRSHDDQRKHRHQCATSRPERTQKCRQPTDTLCHQIGNRLVRTEARTEQFL